MTPDPVVAALAALRDAGMVTDRDRLNAAWAELVGRTPPTSGTRCSCGQPGTEYREPAGVWCSTCRPVLWRLPPRPWATPACHRCGRPGAYPNKGNQSTRPACRDHAPRWLKRHLTPTTEETP